MKDKHSSHTSGVFGEWHHFYDLKTEEPGLNYKFLHRADQADASPPKLRLVDEPFQPDSALSDRIERCWLEMSARSVAKGRAWYNGEIWSPLDFRDNSLLVRSADFKSYIGTRRLSADISLRDRVSPVSVAILPIEVDHVGGPITSLRFFRRHGNSLDFAGYFSGLGGLMDPEKDGLSPIATAIREVGEECGLNIAETQLTYLGAVSVSPQGSVSFCYLLELDRSSLSGGFEFADGEMTHSIRVPSLLLRAVQWKVTPAAGWVKGFARLVLDLSLIHI